MAFAEYQRERTDKLVRESTHRSIFPARDIPRAVFRLAGEDKKVRQLAAKIKKTGIEKILPAEVLVKDEKGKTCLDLAIFETPGTLTQSLEEQNPGMLELARLLNQDLLFGSGESTGIARFRRNREKIAREVGSEMVTGLKTVADFEYELVGEDTERAFTSPEEKESFDTLQTFSQNIVDRLFVAAGLDKLRPKVLVTRSQEVNAWVWSVGSEDAAREYLETAKKSSQPLELPIFINFGLLQGIGSPDELAGILAHEFSHLLQPNYLGLQDNETRQRLEYDADKAGARLADAAGFNPRGLITALRRLGKGSTLQKFGWGTHPEQERRITELEKEFNRTDLPLPNAAKEFGAVPTEVMQAIRIITDLLQKKTYNPNQTTLSKFGTEANFEQQTDPRFFINVETQKKCNEEAKARLKEIQVEQELAHDVTGQRTLLLRTLESTLLGLSQRPLLASDESIVLDRCPTYLTFVPNKRSAGITDSQDSVILKALPETVLSLPKSTSFLRPGEIAEVSQETKTKIKNEEELQTGHLLPAAPPEVQAAYAAGWRAKTIEDWIDPTNPTVQPFWDELGTHIRDSIKQRGDDIGVVQFTREERLYHIYGFLKELTKTPPPMGYYGDRSWLSLKKFQATEIQVEIPVPMAKPNVFDHIPLPGGRVHQRKQDLPIQPVLYKTERSSVEKSLSALYNSGRDLIQNVWDARPENQPPALRDYCELIQDQTAAAYQKVLEFEGVQEEDQEVWHYICARLFDSGFREGQWSSADSNSKLSLQFAPEISISFFDRAVKLLETKKLAKIFGIEESPLNTRQKTALEALRTAIAFGLTPQTDEEKIIQQRYLREIELYQSAAMKIVDTVAPDQIVHPNERHAHFNKDISAFEVDSFAPGQMAMSERVWSETADIVEHLKQGKTFKALQMPTEFRVGEPTAKDEELIRVYASSLFYDDNPAVRTAMQNSLKHFPSVVRGYLDYLYEKGVATKEAVANLYTAETAQASGQSRSEWYALSPFVHTVAQELLQKFGEDLKIPKDRDHFSMGSRPATMQDIKTALYDIIRGSLPISATMKHARFASLDSPWLEQQVAPTNVTNYSGIDREKILFYTPHESPKQFGAEPAATKERAVEYLDMLSETNPAAATLAATLRTWPHKTFPEELGVVCLGHFTDFRKYYPNDSVKVGEIIKIWREAAAVYREQWQHVEQYKCLDEQLSAWEWTQPQNNLFKQGVKDGEWRLKYYDKKIVPELSNKADAFSLPCYIEKVLSESLQGRYRNASNNYTTVAFSWPLFMSDVWEGQEVFTHKDTADTYKTVIDNFRAELQRIVADPTNLAEIKNMQPGFFREFLVAKKIEHFDLKNLDELEPWLEFFTSRAHEGSSRNQITGLIETNRQQHREDRKRELLQAAVLEFLPHPDYLKYISLSTGLDEKSLSDLDVNISFNWNIHNDIEKLVKQIEALRLDPTSGSGGDRLALKKEEQALRQFHGATTNGWWTKRIYERYAELVNGARETVLSKPRPTESEVFVFSDQVIENDKSRLEVGPIYRYRLAAQKLMDWHSAALRSETSNSEDIKKLAVRVNRILPERHPLKDVFVKNQAAVEIWQTLQRVLPPEQLAALGLELTEKTIDIVQALDKFPLYAEVAFLKQYSIFEVVGLDKAITDIPRDTAEIILQRLETVVLTEISPDQHTVMRRLLLQLEKKVRWPELRAVRQTDSGIYDQQVNRILSLYPEPSLERDDLLESIAMDLAYTPEQIREVGHLTYLEQMRWPKETEAKSLRPKYTALEKMRGFLGTLKAVERTQYIAWFAGGPMPLAETLSAEKTGISLEDRAQNFWGLSPIERRNLLYDFCLGAEGIMESTGRFNTSAGKPWPERLYGADMIKYVADNLFTQAFGDNLIDPELPPEHATNTRGREMIQTIFSEMLVHQPEAGRRAELLTNILEAIGSVRQEGRNLRAGELIRILLEQIGVVGIKIGQVMSEQVGLLPESIRQDLLQLKDRTAQFSKRGILTYLESAGWVQGNDSKVEMIGDALGSASIKQVQDCRLTDGREVAAKAKRPSIDKNYQADLKVAERVFHSLEQKGFAIPSYLLPEVERVITEELSFIHEAENQVAMGESLGARNAKLQLDFGNGAETVPLAVSAPLAVSEVIYPDPGETADIGLIVEEKVKGLSLKEMQAYQAAARTGDTKKTKEFRDKITHLYDKSRVDEIEGKIISLDIPKLQASLALEFLRQVVKGGIFHADLHSGNFYLDFTPQIAGGEIYNQRAVFIDLGSAGYSKTEAMPGYVRETVPDNFSSAESFRDFLSALFSQTPKSGKIAEIVNRFSGLSWDAARVQEIAGSTTDTGDQVKKIFYAILNEGRGKIDAQFRYFLKAVATAADHLTKLQEAVKPELELIKTGRVQETVLLPQLMNEGLLNLNLLL